MYFYVDESGHTGTRLFDPDQPTLYYGVLASATNLDIHAAAELLAIRQKLDVTRMHAADLGYGRLIQVAPELRAIQTKFDLVFNFHRVVKPDHAIISFFDQVFDSGMNKAAPGYAYWTPLRYTILLYLSKIFNKPVAQLAWAARIETRAQVATPQLQDVCRTLLKRMGRLKSKFEREIIRSALKWAAQNPDEISYNVSDKDQIKQISPNIIGFQLAMNGIAKQLLEGNANASEIIVDRQTEFNAAQRTLAEFYAKAANIEFPNPPDMPPFDLKGMPQIPIQVKPGDQSYGLELVDVYLWLFKRWHEGHETPAELLPLLEAQEGRGHTDEVSLEAIYERWIAPR